MQFDAVVSQEGIPQVVGNDSSVPGRDQVFQIYPLPRYKLLLDLSNIRCGIHKHSVEQPFSRSNVPAILGCTDILQYLHDQLLHSKFFGVVNIVRYNFSIQ